MGDRFGDLAALHDAAVVIRSGVVEWLGPDAGLPGGTEAPELDVGGAAVLPGWVDAHTHLVFAGQRAHEFAARMRGESYADVLARGGGIMRTVLATRAAPSPDLVEAVVARVRRMQATGSTTLEVKTGYGLAPAEESRHLDVIREAAARVEATLVPTFLGAHVVPAEWRHDRAAYVACVTREMLPEAAGRAEFCDVFCDAGAFSVEEARAILDAALAAGLGVRMHAEQLAHSGGARLAAELGAASADHLGHADAADAAALAAAGTCAVLLPTADLCTDKHYPDARMLRDAGVRIALATDCNPGTAASESMPLAVALGCLELGLTAEEALWAGTRGGAESLRRPGVGRLAPGTAGDLQVLDAETVFEVPYRVGTPLPTTVVIGGAPLPGARAATSRT